MTLTIELGRDIIKVQKQKSCPHVKRFSRESAELQTHTHAHTYTGPILLPRPLTRDVKININLKGNVNKGNYNNESAKNVGSAIFFGQK